MFPKGAPGVALLLLRFVLGLEFVVERWTSVGSRDIDWSVPAAALVAAFIWAGALTPIACAACALLELGTWAMDGMIWLQMPLCSLLVAIALGLLGPGAYSLDGRAFGRRKVVFPPSESEER